MRHRLSSSEDTISFGKHYASLLPAGSIIALSGDLGAGKTTFVQGIAQGLSISESVQSPTFNYLNIYHGALPLYHFDLYRMKGPSDFFSMGFEEYFNSDGITVIEWAERLDGMLPPHTLFIHFCYDGNERVAKTSLPTGSNFTINLLKSY